MRQACLHLPECPRCTDAALAPEGHGLCRCGQVSPHLISFKDRRGWHNDHLLEVNERRLAEGMGGS